MTLVLENVVVPGELHPSARVFGTPPRAANAWGIGKKPLGAGRSTTWARCTHPDGNGTHLREWPLSDLTQEAVRERWGAGDYRVYWFVLDPDNADTTLQRQGAGTSQTVTFEEQAPPPRVAAPLAAAPPAPSSAFEQSMQSALQFMALTDQRAQSQLQNILTAAQAFGGGNRGGIDQTTLTLVLENQRMQMASLMTEQRTQHETAMTALRGELAAIRAELVEEEDEDDAAPLADAARAAAPLFKRGQSLTEGVQNALGNYMAEHPDKVFDLVAKVPGLIAKLSEASQQQNHAAAAAAPAPPLPRPRAIAVASVTPIRVPEPPPTPPPASGLNAVLSQPPKEVAPPPPPPPVVEAIATP